MRPGDLGRAAAVKPVGEAWVYSRRHSGGDVSPLLAAAVALHVADVELADSAVEIAISLAPSAA